MKSMTGFGRGEASIHGKKVISEIKSLNHRFLDIRCRLPRAYSGFEIRIHRLIQNRFHRGRFDVDVRIEREPDTPISLELDEAQARAIFEAYSRLQSLLGLPGDIDLALLGSHRDLWRQEDLSHSRTYRL